jgi:Rps23 Pro-64 3,4-dihydroxylase Tpa1-like proline 4-hydroxylase
MTPVRIENVLNSLDYERLANFILPDETNFPWYFYADSAYKNGGEQVFQFVHNVYRDSKVTTLEWLYSITQKVVNKLPDIVGDKDIEIYRAKFNLLTRQPHNKDDLVLSKHVDRDEDEYISMVYYLEDSDGDTVIYNKHQEEKYRFTPKANTCIIFKSNTWHRATPPTENKARRVLNIVVKVL